MPCAARQRSPHSGTHSLACGADEGVPAPEERRHAPAHRRCDCPGWGPQIIIAGEPTTNLDVTIQLQYLNFLKDLQRASGVALICVTHNLGIVAKMCDTVAVMYGGKIVELQSVRGLFYDPRHPYTKALLDSIPKLGTKAPLYTIPGQPPDLSALPQGCSFHPRCPYVMDHCRTEEPTEHRQDDGGRVRCWRAMQAAERA